MRSGWIAAVRGRKEIGVSGAKLAAFGFSEANGPPLRPFAGAGLFVAVLATVGRLTGTRRDFCAARAFRFVGLLRLAIAILLGILTQCYSAG